MLHHFSIATMCLLGACVGPSAEETRSDYDEHQAPESGTEPGSPQDGADQQPGANPSSTSVSVGNTYEIDTTLNLTAASLASDSMGSLLQDLHNDPGAALVTLASAAGVPAAQTLFDALPSSLESRLVGWMNEAISTNSELQAIIALSQVILVEVHLQSEIEIVSLDNNGEGKATHTLHTATFGAEATPIVLPSISSLPGAGHSEVDIWLEGNTIVYGEQRFGLLLGEAAYQHFQSLLDARYGHDLRTELGQQIDCASMAESVSNQCVFGICVGHESELSQLCEGALDSIDEKIHDQFRSFDTELLVLKSGEALMAGDLQPKMTQGIWDAEMELGLGLRQVPASFHGVQTAP